jgi:hypothetical protein
MSTDQAALKQETALSFGEKRVRTQFNASNDSTVQHIKERAAEFINYVNDHVKTEDGESTRLKSLALTAIEEGAMWAVKAATA